VAEDRTAGQRFGAPLLLITALVLVAVLASNLANLAEPLERLPSVPRPTSDSVVLSSWLVAALIWGIGGTVLTLLIVVLVLGLRKPRQKEIAIWELLARVLGIVALLVSLLVSLYLFPQARRAGQDADAPNGGTGAAEGAAASAGSLDSVLLGVPGLTIVSLTAVIITAALGIALALLFRRHRSVLYESILEPERPAPEARAVVARTIERAIEELELGLEPREAILRCYGALCALLVRRGLGGLEPLTPREVERLAIAQFGLSVDDIGALTSLFEEARYSDHPLGPSARERALLALARLRSALGA